MSGKEIASWILTFLACVAMIFGVVVAIALLLSIPAGDGDDREQWRTRTALVQAYAVADSVQVALYNLGLPGEGAGYEQWTAELCDSLSSGDFECKVLSGSRHPNPQGYYVAVLRQTFEGRAGWLTYTVVLKARRPDEFDLVVARIPQFESRGTIPTVMLLARRRSGPRSREQFVATPEFWRQAEPDALGAFPGRSIDADPLPQFFERFGSQSERQ